MERNQHLGGPVVTCEVCGNRNLRSVLNIGEHPLCDDLVPISENRSCEEYPIEIVFCDECLTAHQRFQVPKRTLFPATYHYRSRFTADVLSGMSALVDACEKRIGSLREKKVLDVGCNDGSLLDFFKRKGAITLGVEPTDAFLDGLDKGHHLTNGFFDPKTAQQLLSKHGVPDVITFTNVFAHIENLPELIAALKLLMGPSTLLVVENHYLGAVIDRYQFDTFYHEHPRTYSLTSFMHIAKNLGFQLNAVEFPSRYGGNIRVFIGGPKEVQDQENLRAVTDIMIKEKQFESRLIEMQDGIIRWKRSMKQQISDLVAIHGKLSAKAFPGRAAILIKLLDLDSGMIEAVYEKPGSMKIGNYLPGTRIPIRSDDDFWSITNKPTILLNLAWHISAEIRAYLSNHSYTGQVIDIFDPSEFALSLANGDRRPARL